VLPLLFTDPSQDRPLQVPKRYSPAITGGTCCLLTVLTLLWFTYTAQKPSSSGFRFASRSIMKRSLKNFGLFTLFVTAFVYIKLTYHKEIPLSNPADYSGCVNLPAEIKG
jgi:hypothetical protein